MSRRSSGYIAVDQDDLEDGSIALTEVPQYVKVYFGDNTDGRHIPNESETDMFGLSAYRRFDGESGRQVIYVENALTGEFVPIELKPKKFDDKYAPDTEAAATGDTSDTGHPGDNSDETGDLDYVDPFADDGNVDISHVQYENFLRVVFILCQGLLAGFSFVSLYMETSTQSDTEILEGYLSQATEYRRLFYLLSTLSLVGSIDLLMTVPKSTAVSGTDAAATRGNIILVSAVAVFCFCVCFLVSLVIGIMDTLVAYRDGFPDENFQESASVSSSSTTTVTISWADKALDDSFFAALFSVWHTLGDLRFVTALAGFMASCFLLWIDFIRLHEKKQEIFEMHGKNRENRRKIAELYGENLGELSVMELQSLLTQQKLGADRTQEALNAFGEDN